MHTACENGHVEVLELLMNNLDKTGHLDINAQEFVILGAYEHTPLFDAVYNRQTHVVHWMCMNSEKHGIDFDIQCARHTALDFARRKRMEEIMDLLSFRALPTSYSENELF